MKKTALQLPLPGKERLFHYPLLARMSYGKLSAAMGRHCDVLRLYGKGDTTVSTFTWITGGKSVKSSAAHLVLKIETKGKLSTGSLEFMSPGSCETYEPFGLTAQGKPNKYLPMPVKSILDTFVSAMKRVEKEKVKK